MYRSYNKIRDVVVGFESLQERIGIETGIKTQDELERASVQWVLGNLGAIPTVTIDYKTLENQTVTIRDRDSWKQVRTSIKQLSKLLHVYFIHKREFADLD